MLLFEHIVGIDVLNLNIAILNSIRLCKLKVSKLNMRELFTPNVSIRVRHMSKTAV